MRRHLSAGLLFALLLTATIAVGCAREAEEPEVPAVEPSASETPAPAEPDAPAKTDDTAEDASADDGRPSVADAEAAMLRIAREMYQDMPIEGAAVGALGRDSRGRWWAQGWTSAGQENESEQWFIAFDGAEWEFVDAGTGLERSDLPDDIAWEDVR
jgi:hypothetical protein